MFIFRDYMLLTKANIRWSLAGIYGIGLSRASYVCGLIGFGTIFPMRYLTSVYFQFVLHVLRSFYTSGDSLRHILKINYSNFLEARRYRGLRRKMYLPVRGQRTHTNARTWKRFNKAGGKKVRK